MTWAVLGESVAGTSHRARGLPCQDACRFSTFGPRGEWLVVAVADGAGSASHAQVGAAAACDELARRVGPDRPGSLLGREGMHAIISEVRQALVAEAGRLGVPPREVACTAILAIVGPEGAAFAQVGDGCVVVGGGAGYEAVFWPEPAEYANATDFLTDERFVEAFRFATIPRPLTEVAVFTDGLQRLALDFSARAPHPGFFGPLFGGVRTAENPSDLGGPFRSFLDSARVNERTDDDKTLVLAVRRP